MLRNKSFSEPNLHIMTETTDSPEILREQIISENLAKLLSQERGGMQYSLGRESMGGNAGTYQENGRKFSCAGANFSYGPDGRIIIFGNIQDLTDEQKKLQRARYRVAIDFENQRDKIVETNFIEEDPADSTKQILDDTASKYNSKNGWL